MSDVIAFDTRGWDWDHSDFSESAVSDSGPWVWWLPLAWRAATDPLGAHPLPPPPGPLRWEDKDGPHSHAYTIAWWAPLLHLLFFGLGWVQPDLGLARWLDGGQSDDDPVLRTVKRWWGPYVADLLAWAGGPGKLHDISSRIAEATGTTATTARLPDRWAGHRSPGWEQVWGGGGDSLHLGAHVITAAEAAEYDPHDVVLATDLVGSPRAVLSLPAYQGWYTTLGHFGAKLPARADGRMWRVSVIIRPLGSLGVYRQSRDTGRWFSGRHRWHQLGSRESLSE